MFTKSIGIIGGFGAYATLDFYKRILEIFASDNERNYPHIYMDNNFTMPSRTRALLYNESYDEVVNMIAESVQKMYKFGADYIILVCGTAHAFLPDVYKILPEAKERVLNIIELLGDKLLKSNCLEAFLIAAEGTLKKKVYQKIINNNKVKLINPGYEKYTEIRYFIESVKRNNVTEETYTRFMAFLEEGESENVVLGCTEFPVLVNLLKQYDVKEKLEKYHFYDPLEVLLDTLKIKMEDSRI